MIDGSTIRLLETVDPNFDQKKSGQQYDKVNGFNHIYIQNYDYSINYNN